MGIERHFAYLPLKDRATMHAAMVEALTARALSRPARGDAAQYLGLKLLDYAAMCAPKAEVMQRDVQHLATQALAHGGHTTSDFPAVLQDAANKVLEESYGLQSSSYRQWSSRRQFKDFKAHKFVKIGDFPPLSETREPGTVSWGTVDERREEMRLATFTSGIGFSREALVNDDLSALSAISDGAAVVAANCENTLAYDLIASNPVMSDGEALFSEAHGNLAGTPSTIDVANVALAVKAMRLQTTASGQPLNIRPAVLVCGPAKELAARQLLGGIVAANPAAVNPYAAAFELVVDAQIAGNEWYLFASPTVAPVVVFGHLRDQTGPETWITRDDDTRGVRIHVGLDFAVGAIDWRGAYKNAGA